MKDLQLLLILVAYHPDAAEVEELKACLDALPEEIGYAVVANDHQPGEPVDRLAAGAELYLPLRTNPGYGRAANRILPELRRRRGHTRIPPWIGVLNTDLSWPGGTFEATLTWLEHHPDVVMAVPAIHDPEGRAQHLCKRDPTVLALLSRRFLPKALKPSWLRRYDAAYVMAEQDPASCFDVPYLSGCCMLIRRQDFEAVGGFDEKFFLYLEDADITRRLRQRGRCVHLPLATVIHNWGRGNHRSLRLTVVNLHSAWIYFSKWGWRWW